jgi:glutamine synthetase
VLRVLGNTTSRRVLSNVGGEQEYFLVDLKFLEKRLDLFFCGRTLFGAPAPKGQEMEDHYFGSLHERVASYMNDINQQLWRLGVSAKTQHNEVAPAQYELAPVFGVTNVAVDQNQLVMETLQKVARRHNFVCLLHEKPFAGVNGSGKHNNWSMATDDGINLLAPGETPHDNLQFLVFLFAVIRAVDKHAGLLRASVAVPGNDLRLGANEAPPAIISIFLGEQLIDVYEQIEKGTAKSSKARGVLKLGVSTLPPLQKDSTDRNRTSPFAYTGNKFEFRMPGSSMSLSDPNIIINTIVADALCEMADELEKPSKEDLLIRIQNLLQKYAKEHRRVIFNGDGYTESWKKEAARRGLPNLTNTVDALGEFAAHVNMELFGKHEVFSEEELHARYEIMMENYVKTIMIEARTAVSMVNRQIQPAVLRFAREQAETVAAFQKAWTVPVAVAELLDVLRIGIDEIGQGTKDVEAAMAKVSAISDISKQGKACRDQIKPALETLRKAVDAMEKVVSADLWPLPTYTEMLFQR